MDRVLVAVLALLLAGCASASKPLAQAALNGDTATVQALLAQGARVNGRGPAGITALMLARSAATRRPCAPPRRQGRRQCQPRQAGDGRTALIDAAWGGHTEIVRPSSLVTGPERAAERRDRSRAPSRALPSSWISCSRKGPT